MRKKNGEESIYESIGRVHLRKEAKAQLKGKSIKKFPKVGNSHIFQGNDT